MSEVRARSSPPPVGPDPLARALLRWFDREERPLPWRRDRSPYRVWVAEVLLQQTRVAQAIPYYERFVRQFPTVRALAAAPRDRVLKAWQGAGYYARARHLHAAARLVVRRRAGRIPSSVEELERLPGVGPYIARAIASLAFDVRVVALEANGLRVAARWTRESRRPDGPAARRRLEGALRAHLPLGSAGRFNEALMELGETVCLPSAPDCPRCPVTRWCRAFRELEDPGSIPPPRRRPVRPHQRAAVVVLHRRGRWLLQRRPPEKLLGGLWEFPGGRIERGETPEAAARRELAEETGLRAGRLAPRGVVRHAYSHFTVELHVFEGPLAGSVRRPLGPYRRWVRPDEIGTLPLPKATEKIVARLAVGRASPD